MKTFLITILFLTIFTNCSTNNAFSYFDMNQKQAKSEDSLQSSKIFNKKSNEGIVSVIYLNRVLADEFSNKEYFYIYLYVKNRLEPVEFFLNGEKSQEVKILKPQNKFSQLSSFNPKWQKYYLVAFSKQERETLRLKVQTSQSSSGEMIFQTQE